MSTPNNNKKALDEQFVRLIYDTNTPFSTVEHL